MRRRQDRLVGIGGAQVLRNAAREMDILGKVNARIAEVDARAHQYAPAVHDVFYIETQHGSGMYEARSVEDIAGQGPLHVFRSLRDNILPALTMQMIGKLIRGGVFNDFAAAKAYVLDECQFRCADKVDA
jgi:hypothetical protein